MDPFIEAEEADGHSVKRCCELFEGPRAPYYQRHNGAPSARELSDAVLLERIHEIHHASNGSYGSPRVTKELNKRGVACGRRRVGRLMRLRLEHATRTLLDRGERVLTVTGSAPKLSDTASGRSLSVDFVPYSAVLAQCRAIVHHAGIGTTLASMRAGLPQVAVPKSHDQADTARLIERAGVGVKLSWRRRGRALGTALSRILAEPEFEATAKRLSRNLGRPQRRSPRRRRIEELVGDNAQPR